MTDTVPVSTGGGITISVPASALTDDPWHAFREPPKDETPPDAVSSGTSGDPWSAFREPPRTDDSAPPKALSAGDAFGSGAVDAATFGLAPAIAGAHAAGQDAIPPDISAAFDADPTGQTAAGADAWRAIVGAKRVLSGDDKDATAAYDKARLDLLDTINAARQQHPYASLGGQVVGALATPVPGLLGGASIPARLLRSVTAGAIGTAAYDAGSAVSEGKSLPEVAKAAGDGAATGAGFGVLGSGLMEGASAIGSKLMSIFRGTRDADAEAARRVVTAIQADRARAGGYPFDAEASQAASAAGLPTAIVDLGGERTRALLRSSANTSPEARAALEDAVQPRFEEQSPRIAGFIRRITGNPDAANDTEILQGAARAANKPAYQAAYKAGDRGLWSPELERLAGSPAVADAAKGAVERGKNRAINDGFGAFNPSLGANGVPTYPNLQFWDYTQRELKDAANAAQRGGRNEEAATLFGLHKQLRSEIDRMVPKFAEARQGASAFFKAENALDAGRGFVSSNADISGARNALAKMSRPERELFARGFASELAGRIEGIGDRRNVINSVFLGNSAARQRIKLALGSERMRQVEALLRVETLADQARRALGNSTTARQLTEMGMAGGALAGVEYLKEGKISPTHAVAGAITFGLMRHGATKIDERVARRVGELLAQQDSHALFKGIRIVTENPDFMTALRRATGAFVTGPVNRAVNRVGAKDIGGRRSAAAAAVGLEHLITGEGEGETEPSGPGLDHPNQ